MGFLLWVGLIRTSGTCAHRPRFSYGVFVVIMLRSCKYCGRIHEDTAPCEQKTARIKARQACKYEQDAAAFRRRSTWTAKSKRVKERDHYICLCCEHELVGTIRRYEPGTEVHHIVPVAENKDLRMKESNLITVCKKHHEMCESGQITREQQRQLVAESMARYNRTATSA